jgi:hypothetical protein
MSESRVEELLRAGRATGFAPGFAGRVMHRLRTEALDPRAALAAALQRWFVRLAPVAALAAAVLLVLNVRAAGRGQSPIDAALGLPATTLEQAYAPYEAAATPQTERPG